MFTFFNRFQSIDCTNDTSIKRQRKAYKCHTVVTVKISNRTIAERYETDSIKSDVQQFNQYQQSMEVLLSNMRRLNTVRPSHIAMIIKVLVQVWFRFVVLNTNSTIFQLYCFIFIGGETGVPGENLRPVASH